jgi:hypothetical protein
MADSTCYPVRIPDAIGRIDGAVVELQVGPDGIITAEIRIPARQPQETA